MGIDPRKLGPKPPFPRQEQTHPGTVKKLNPPADHGEDSYVGTEKLRGRVAIVTGADSGIGRAVAIAFAKEGADVLFSYLPEGGAGRWRSCGSHREGRAPSSSSFPATFAIQNTVRGSSLLR